MKVEELIEELQKYNPNDRISVHLEDHKIPLNEEDGYQLWSPKVVNHKGWEGLITIELDGYEGG